MTREGHASATDLEAFDDPIAAYARIEALYEESRAKLNAGVTAFAAGRRDFDLAGATYPYVGVSVSAEVFDIGPSQSYGTLPGPGSFGTTLTRPTLFRSYYIEQMRLLCQNYGQPILVGRSDCPIPLPFVTEAAANGVGADDLEELQRYFPLPDLMRIDDSIANGTWSQSPGCARPLALFQAERVDYSLVRLTHYTGTSPAYFQRFVLFTNYQRYVEEFIERSMKEVREGTTYKAFVQPGNEITRNPRLDQVPPRFEEAPERPQMPAYHLMRDRHMGITLVNIGVGPSNAKTITDHIAVMRPHCWMIVGHCGGLRKTQRLGDYVLAHAYARSDNVLDEDLPGWVPVPPIAEVQVALGTAVAEVTGLEGAELKTRLRTGTVFTTDDRDWELRQVELSRRLQQSRAIAVDMESATIAANGYRFRVPYGTLLCVSDKPLHGELKLPGMATAFYRQRISQHLEIGLRTIGLLRDGGVETLHSRKLRSFDEPAFR